MTKKLIKWLFQSQKQIDELDERLNAIGISISPLREARGNFTNYNNALEIILEDIELPEDFDEERMMEDFWYGTDFEAFWSEYGEVFVNHKVESDAVKLTNYRKIKNMSVEQMAEFLKSLVDENSSKSIACYRCSAYGTHHSDIKNKGTGLYECEGCSQEGIGLDLNKWLESEADTE